MYSLSPGGNTPFWHITAAGAKAAAELYDVDLTLELPQGGYEEQTKLPSAVSEAQYDGVAVSPRAPDKQNKLLSKLADKVHLITFDSDAPDSNRLCYIGTDNYSAGRLAAQLIKQAVPDDGKVALMIANTNKDNAVLRVKGFREEINRYTFNEEVGAGAEQDRVKYEVLNALEDGIDKARARENARQTLNEHPDLTAFVSMFSYHGPVLLDVLEESSHQVKPQLIVFDEEDVVLKGWRRERSLLR